MKFCDPLPPVVVNVLILLGSGLAASMLCAKVYGAELPKAEAPAAPVPPAATIALPASVQSNPVLALIGSQGALPIAANGLQMTAPVGR